MTSMRYGLGCSLVFRVAIWAGFDRYLRLCEGHVWQLASLTRCKDIIQAGSHTDLIIVDLLVVCSRKSLQEEQYSLHIGTISVRLVKRAQNRVLTGSSALIFLTDAKC